MIAAPGFSVSEEVFNMSVGQTLKQFAFALMIVLGVTMALPGGAFIGMAHAAETSIPSDLSAKALLIHATRAGERIVAVGEWGHIVLSDDNGKTWRQAKNVPTRNTLTSVNFTDAQTGWAVGYDTLILHTTDGGETWTEQYRNTEQDDVLLTIWFENAQHGIAFGAFGLTVETMDGGKSWTQRLLIEDTEDDFHLNFAFETADGALFITAEAGFVYRSLDKGASWESIVTGYEGSFWAGLGMPDGGILIMGMRGNVYRSDDKGDSWTRVETGTKQSLTNGVTLEGGAFVAVGMAGTVLASTDQGRSFTMTERKDRKAYSAVLPGAGDDVLLFGEAGVLHHNLKGDAS